MKYSYEDVNVEEIMKDIEMSILKIKSNQKTIEYDSIQSTLNNYVWQGKGKKTFFRNMDTIDESIVNLLAMFDKLKGKMELIRQYKLLAKHHTDLSSYINPNIKNTNYNQGPSSIPAPTVTPTPTVAPTPKPTPTPSGNIAPMPSSRNQVVIDKINERMDIERKMKALVSEIENY